MYAKKKTNRHLHSRYRYKCIVTFSSQVHNVLNHTALEKLNERYKMLEYEDSTDFVQ
jgi:hypothetical protein